MQLCPCIRLRLWRRQQWEAVRRPAPAVRAARGARGLAHVTAHPTPAQAFAADAQKRSPVPSLAAAPLRRPIGRVKASRKAATRLNGALRLSENDELHPKNVWFWTSMARYVELSANRSARLVKHEMRRRVKQQPHLSFAWGQRLRLARGLGSLGANGQQAREAHVLFWAWKRDLALSMKMTLYGDVPDEASAIYRWWRLLQPAEADDGGGGTVERAKAEWAGLPPGERQAEWAGLMLASLVACPDRTPDLLLATSDATDTPLYCVEDIVYYLGCLRDLASATPQLAKLATPTADDLVALVQRFGEARPGASLLLRQTSIVHLARHLPTPGAVWELYRLLVARNNYLNKNTALQIASRLAKSQRLSHKKMALDVLEDTLSNPQLKLDINSPQASSVCTLILTHESSRGEGAKGGFLGPGLEPLDAVDVPAPTDVTTPAEMFETLLRYGFKPNLITYTTLIRGLCLRNEFDGARQVLELMVKNEITPDAYIYSTMMNGAKASHNMAAIQQAAGWAVQDGVHHPYVWNDFLQALFAAASAEVDQLSQGKRSSAVPAFPLMVQAYTRIFKREQLQALLPDVSVNTIGTRTPGAPGVGGAGVGTSFGPGLAAQQRWSFLEHLAPTVYGLPALPAEEAVEPTAVTLSTMVVSYIHALSSPHAVLAYYERFRQLVREENRTALYLVGQQGTIVHDAVVMALCRDEEMIRAAVNVVNDMRLASKANPALAPSIYTWTILLQGFMRHRKTVQAERILRAMRESGVEPNQVTWNTLMAGYAHAQDARLTARAMLRLERAGFEPDDYTFRAFSYLRKKNAALRYLEEHRAARAARAAADAAVDGPAAVAGTAADSPLAPSSALAAAPPPGALDSAFRAGAGFRRSGKAGAADKHHPLQDEVEEIAKMMDEEQRDGAAGGAGAAGAAGEPAAALS